MATTLVTEVAPRLLAATHLKLDSASLGALLDVTLAHAFDHLAAAAAARTTTAAAAGTTPGTAAAGTPR